MRQGTTLFEVVVYIACCLVICSLAGHLSLTLRKTAQERIQIADTWVSLSLALNRLVDDLKRAPCNPLYWKKRMKTEIIFSLNGNDYGWLLNKGRLIRITGMYNTDLEKWSKRATSVILNSVEMLSFRFSHRVQG